MVDIQSVMAEIRQGKKRRKKEETTGQKYNGPLLHRVAINIPPHIKHVATLPSNARLVFSHHHTTTVLRPYSQDHPGEPVPEESFFWTLWC